ncbi:MAG: prolipoprotein diacylglyceryl transferase [Patescibacteria group bacterium]
MINFLHTFQPNPILISFGPIHIYWYGLFIVIGILAAIITSLKLATYYSISKNTIIDLAFWGIINGVIGARLYHIFLELPFYSRHPIDIFKIWQGGLAIHGAIIAGLLTAWIFTKKKKINFWLLTSVLVPGLALGQAIGRWGNYFNKELYGKPTNLPWGIPINIMERPVEYISSEFFHPTFLYESLGNFFIFLTLITIHVWIIKKYKSSKTYFLIPITYYLISYSLLRFSLEFIRIDPTPTFYNLRWPQIISLVIIILSIILFIFKNKLPFLKSTDNIKPTVNNNS